MKRLFFTFAIASGFLPMAAFCAPGEMWEITASTKKPHSATPDTSTTRVCLAKGAAHDPRLSTPGTNMDCQMHDVRTTGNTTVWQMRCATATVQISGTGRLNVNTDSYHGILRLNLVFSNISGSDKSEEVPYVTMYTGRRLGRSCDATRRPPATVTLAKK